MIRALTIAALALTTTTANATYAPSGAMMQVDPYIATMSVRILRNQTKFETNKLASLPGRRDVPIFGHMPDLTYSYFPGPSKNSPLVFVVPGLGGASDEGAGLYLADVLNHVGFAAAVVANPFSWKFVLKRAPIAVPGYIPEEAQELAKMMNDVKASLRDEGVRPSSYMAVGYSLGAIHLGFLEMAEKDGTLKSPVGLSKVVMINPPLDLTYALTQLDKLEQFRDHFTKDQQDLMWGQVFARAGSLSAPAKGEDLQSIMLKTMKAMGISRGQAAFLIGESFRQSLTDLMVVSQSVQDRGLLKQPMSQFHRNAREEEASNILYGQYMHNFMMPFWQRHQGTNFDDAGFVAQGSLVKFTSRLAAIPELRLVHNADDFLTAPADLRAVDSALGARAMVMPYGGHVGNLWAPAEQRAIVGLLKN